MIAKLSAERRRPRATRRRNGAKIAERGAERIDYIPSRSIRADAGAAGPETATAANVQRLPTPRRKAAGARCGCDRPTRRGGTTAFTQVECAMLFMGLLAVAGFPFLREAGITPLRCITVTLAYFPNTKYR